MYAYTKLFAVLSVFEARIMDRHENKGVTAIEYALLAAAIAVIIGGLTSVFGTELKAKFDNILA